MFAQAQTRIVAGVVLLLIAINALPNRLWINQAHAQAGSKAKGPVDPRNDDRAAIRAFLDLFVKAFESRDAKALAAQWTTDGEYSRDDGVAIQGREAIEKAFADFFAKTPEVKAEVQPQSLRFVSRDVAMGAGSVTVRRGAAEAATRANYKTLLVREDGKWRLAQLAESTDDRVSISDLGWLIGQWKSTGGQGADILTTYSWSPSKKFINVQFTIKEKDLALSGSQVLGVDPTTGAIHSWTFETDGGVGEGEWSRDGEHWVIDAAGTAADGRTLSETNVLRRVNDDTFTWQSINRLLDDKEIADLPPVKVTRLKDQQ
jgi:uncharacterized protein (TIGR02246 family)